MKHIGDVMRTFSIPLNTNTAATWTEPDAVRCTICNDAGFLRMDVPVGHPNFGRIFPCQCTVERREARMIDDLRRLSNLDAFADRTFESFDAEADGVAEAYAAAVRYARNPHGWLFLHGNCGCGKTHLAVAIAHYAMERQKLSVLFAVVPDLLDHLRATFDPGNGVAYDDRFNAIRNAQLLVLDDLGTENTTPWAREKLYQIFNHRYNEQLPTVITSNQDFKRIEERVLSRLLDTRLTSYIHIDAEDYRRRRVVPDPSQPARRGDR
jgi:DNA replication protein DnaC